VTACNWNAAYLAPGVVDNNNVKRLVVRIRPQLIHDHSCIFHRRGVISECFAPPVVERLSVISHMKKIAWHGRMLETPGVQDHPP
jgi:hypothetical protein